MFNARTTYATCSRRLVLHHTRVSIASTPINAGWATSLGVQYVITLCLAGLSRGI